MHCASMLVPHKEGLGGAFTSIGASKGLLMFLCLSIFHAYNCLPPPHVFLQVPKEIHDHVYVAMESMMQCPTEEEFDSKYRELLWACLGHNNILRYISNGWVAKHALGIDCGQSLAGSSLMGMLTL
ncbi:hypothetical protein GOP47_0004501 [Adiantum capillus-veneris]|uniref:Uncharacterized protein n=1 Tax=Adiantum capillus-veneris TaxID=13818 RepID=A0A9D4V8Z6_ADICA|nr:hypothetical protein GOP47_0004501 [Adiantum capillus-veneris]